MSVCEELKKGTIDKLFCSEQCTGYNKEQRLTFEMCAPSRKGILKTVKKYLKKISAKRLFIGTDNDSMISDFKKALKNMEACIVLFLAIQVNIYVLHLVRISLVHLEKQHNGTVR